MATRPLATRTEAACYCIVTYITEILVCSVLEPMSDNVVCFLRKPTVQRLSGDGDEGDPRWISR